MSRHKPKPSNVNVELAQHCISNVGSVTSPVCPIISERSICEGRGITDRLYEFLVQAVMERNEAFVYVDDVEKPKRKWLVAHAVAESQVAVLSYVVAEIRNPYDPDPEGVLAQAEKDATERVDN